MQTVLSSANAAWSLFTSLGKDGMERDPWVFFKASLVLLAVPQECSPVGHETSTL